MGNIYSTRDSALEKIISLMGYRGDEDLINSIKQQINNSTPIRKIVERYNQVSGKEADVYTFFDVKGRPIEFYISELSNVPVREHNKIIDVTGFSPVIYKIQNYEINQEV